MSKLKSSRGNNALLAQDRTVHSWYRFILSFPPHLVQQYLDRFGVDPSQVVLDPFCGTGTTLVECKKHGIPSIGIEANPVAWFASCVKTTWARDASSFLDHAAHIAERTERLLRDQGIEDSPLFQPLVPQTPLTDLRKLPPESEQLLLTDSISPLPLHKALTLLEVLGEFQNADYSDHERLALMDALVHSSSNLHFGPEAGVGAIKADAPVIEPWFDRIRAMSHDIRTLHDNTTSADVHLADSRNVQHLLEPRSVDVVITSPPYPNEKDYSRTTRLEAVMFGYAHNKAELQAYKRTLLRSNTRTVYKGDTDDQWVADNPAVQQLAQEIEARRLELGKTSGFERLYATVTKLYFGGMARHLAELRPILRPGARLAYVVGDQASYFRVLIRTGQLLAEIAQSLSYDVESIDLFRTRLATSTREQLREEVVVLRWRGA